MEKIITEIKKEMEKQGVSTYKLAELTGLSQQKVFRISAGINKRIDADAINKITSALGMVADPGGAYNVTAIHQGMTPAEAQLLEILRDAPDAREVIEAYIKLPKRKQKILTGKIFEALDEAEREREGE